MQPIPFDFETARFRPGMMAPQPSCMSIAPGGHGAVIPTPEARDQFIWMLRSGYLLLAHHGVYDMLCALAWWDCTEDVVACIDEGRLIDTWDIVRIAEISGHKPIGDKGLDTLCQYFGLRVPAKKDLLDLEQIPDSMYHEYVPNTEVRLSYGPLRDRPLSDYSQQQIDYVCDDAVLLWQLYCRIHERWIATGKVHLHDAAHLTAKRMYLHSTSAWGLRTQADQIEQLRTATRIELARLRTAASELNVIRANSKNKSGVSTNMQVLRDLITQAYDGSPPMTSTKDRDRAVATVSFERRPHTIMIGGAPVTLEWQAVVDTADLDHPFVPQVKTARAVLEGSGDPRLEMLAGMGEWSALESMVLPAYERGVYEPIHTRFSIVDTTRANSAKPNVQNVRRKKGVRECFIPRPGFCFVHVDHGGLENATLAQFLKTILGIGGFADFVNSGGDLHCLVAADAYGCTYERALELHAADDPDFDRVRSAVKPVNFGRPGGAGADTLVFIAKQGFGLDWTREQAQSYIKSWERAVEGGKEFHKWVGQQSYTVNGQQRYAVPILGTTIIRRGCTFCSACNNSFQALGAVVEGYVGWAMLREHLLGRTPEGTPSVLRYCAPCNFIHDEFAWEVPIGLQTQAAARLEWHMANSAKCVMPDVQLGSEAVAMSVWSKKAKRIFRDGQLEIWSPE